jgi:hypothetical protein
MNCCDYNCNQGRECPARVAKYRPVMRAADPLPPGKWRDWLKTAARVVLCVLLGCLLGSVFLFVVD